MTAWRGRAYRCRDPRPRRRREVAGDAVLRDGLRPRARLHGATLPGATPAERAAIYDDMNVVLARLHTVDWQALGLADFGRPGNYFARQIHRWTSQYRASETEKIESMERLITWLPEHIPPADETTIVHGDYRPGNLIVHPTEPRVVARATGSCRPWAIRSPTSPTTASPTTSRIWTRVSTVSTATPRVSPRRRNTLPPTAGGQEGRDSRLELLCRVRPLSHCRHLAGHHGAGDRRHRQRSERAPARRARASAGRRRLARRGGGAGGSR